MIVTSVPLNISAHKPGRTLTQLDLNALACLIGEPLLYPYLVRLQPQSEPAGNHYHKQKKEIFICVEGSLQIFFEDITTREHEEICLSADDVRPTTSEIALIVPVGVAHAVKNIGTRSATLLVLATQKAREPEDDFTYIVT